MLSPPTTFTFSIGGFMGDSFAVKLDDTGILYTSWDRGYSNRRDEHVDVTPKDWAAFRTALDAANVWAWSARYEPVGYFIVDGTGWHFAITWGERSVESSGNNAYPTPPGEPSEWHRPAPSFEALLRAVQRLVGGRRFE